ncbi:MAG: hypothetical protein ACE5IL_05400 [Myxococcota bacterium]
MKARVASRMSDVIVVGTSIGALVSAAYLARAGLRVRVLEEETLGQRPPLLREPFAATGLERGGPLQRVLGELGTPLIERRELHFEPLALQVVMPEARIEVGRGRAALAEELEVYGIAKAPEALDWLEAIDGGGEALRRALQRERGAPPAGLARLLGGARRRREPVDPEWMPALPAVPRALESFVGALRRPSCASATEPGLAATALLIRGTRDGLHEPPHAGRPLADLFRRRIREHHSEIVPAGALAWSPQRGLVGFELARGRLLARALVVGAPMDALRRALAAEGSVPRWLKRAQVPSDVPVHLLRAPSSALPIGMARRGIDASGRLPRWWTRTRDPLEADVDWIVLAGEGVPELASGQPLGGIAPFGGDRIRHVDPGPAPAWDLDPPSLRYHASAPEVLSHQPPIRLVGPERAPELGVEGEVLLARATALELAERLARA